MIDPVGSLFGHLCLRVMLISWRLALLATGLFEPRRFFYVLRRKRCDSSSLRPKLTSVLLSLPIVLFELPGFYL
jgi:hypothetical protein